MYHPDIVGRKTAPTDGAQGSQAETREISLNLALFDLIDHSSLLEESGA
jgi:hypothetical protein